jgi:DNA-binding NarL/FixJ family response regulator
VANIMIVDDSSLIRRNLREILHNMGHQVVAEADDASTAVELYRERSVDLVTMDIQMPGISGIDAVRMIRERDPQALIVMISSMEQKNMVYDAIKQGAKHFIVKPFSDDKVREVVNSVLGPKAIKVPPAPELSVKPKETDPAQAKKREPLTLENLYMSGLPFELSQKDGRVVMTVQRHINFSNIQHLHAAFQGLLYLRNVKYVIDLWEAITDQEGMKLLEEFVAIVRQRKGTVGVVTAENNTYTILKSKFGGGVYKSYADIEW